jgi:ADP-ribose pyrophosphatase
MDIDLTAEQTVSSATIYRGAVLHFMKTTVRLPSGRLHTREIVEHPGAVALIPVLGDTIILIRQYRLAAGRTIYELPAGTLNAGEDPDTCAAREITEETGYRAGKLEKVFQCYLAPGYSTELMHFYVATELEAGPQRLDEDEEIRVYPTPIDEALAMVRRNEIMDAKTAVGLLIFNGLRTGLLSNSRGRSED